MKVIGSERVYIEIDEESLDLDLVSLRLCVANNYLGTLDSPTYIPGFVGSLHSLLNDEFYYSNFISDKNFKSVFYPEDTITDDYKVTFEETFDDFSKRVVRNNKKMYFTWYLHEGHFFKYNNIKVGEIIFVDCSILDFISLLNDFNEWLLHLRS